MSSIRDLLQDIPYVISICGRSDPLYKMAQYLHISLYMLLYALSLDYYALSLDYYESAV